MNQLLFERSSGNIGPNVFARIQTSSLLRSFSAAPRLRFDGGEREPSAGQGGSAAASVRGTVPDGDSSGPALWAHQAGVSALALERFDGRL